MPTRDGPREHAASVGQAARVLGGAIRRMVISLSSEVLWQVTGHQLLDNTTETYDAEPFTGVGFYSRPHDTAGTPEAIVAGASTENPTIIATRDEATRKAMIGDAPSDMAAMFNTLAMVYIKPDGTIWACAKGATPQRLMLLSEGQAMHAAMSGHTHPAGDGTTHLVAPTGGGPVTGATGASATFAAPVGTPTLRG